jgi:hypothetical protein
MSLSENLPSGPCFILRRYALSEGDERKSNNVTQQTRVLKDRAIFPQIAETSDKFIYKIPHEHNLVDG